MRFRRPPVGPDDALRSQPSWRPCQPSCCGGPVAAETCRRFLAQSLPLVRAGCRAPSLPPWRVLEAGQWRVLAEFGPPAQAAAALLADALDRERAVVDGALDRGAAGAACRLERSAGVCSLRDSVPQSAATATTRALAAVLGAALDGGAGARACSGGGSSGWKRS